MATIPLQSDNRGDVQNIRWLSLAAGDEGQPWELPNYADKTFSILIASGSASTVVLQGSNVWNPVLTTDADWHTLTDTTETDISTTTKLGGQILQNYRWLRPKSTGGTSVVNVHICAAKGY